MSNKPYKIPQNPHTFEEEIKRSRFITYLAHTPSVEEAQAFIQSIKAKHQDARHNCWAYAAGHPEDSLLWGCSDDGEPSGTAGKPMLSQLSGSGIGEICAVTTRYFGGTRLGTGGLVKAYGGGVKQALQGLSTEEKLFNTMITLEVSFDHLAQVERTVSEFEALVTQREYSNAVHMTIEIAEDNATKFQLTLADRCSGHIEFLQDDV